MSQVIAPTALALCSLGFFPTFAAAQERYHLFRPVPPDQMRKFVTDRPDFTEAAITVPAGHFQAEISFFDFSRDTTHGTRSHTDLFGNFNLKLGLLDPVDIQFVVDAHTQTQTTTGGRTLTDEGFSNLTTRLKVNLWGNDGGTTAFALLPYVSAPTSGGFDSGEWEGGLILPFSTQLTDAISFGAMLQIDFTHDPGTGNHSTDWIHTFVVGLPLTETTGTYLEYVGIAGSASGSDYQALFSSGFTWATSPKVQFDLGVRIGMTPSAEDFGVFSGVSYRY